MGNPEPSENLPWVPETRTAPIPSLEQIARRAQVSRSTVSRVMRNDPRISPETARRVRDAAKQLDYRPNPLLSTLMERVRVGRNVSYQGTIGVVTDEPDAPNWYRNSTGSWTRIHAGASQRAQERGYKIECFSVRDYPADGRRLSQVLRSRDIHGVYVTPGFAGRELRLEWDWFSAATTGHGLVRPELHRVCYHNYHGIQLACRQLRAAGYRRVGLYMEQRNNEVTDNNYLAGFLLFLQSVPTRNRLAPALVARYERDEFRAWFRELRPDAVISSKGVVADWARELGVRCPEDFGFVHLDHTPNLSQWAGINHHNELIGRGVIDLILAQVHRGETGIPVHPTTTMIEGFWAEGPSVRAIPRAEVSSAV
jgi:DNA-binding LacI/PurR family transcriptional regulator